MRYFSPGRDISNKNYYFKTAPTTNYQVPPQLNLTQLRLWLPDMPLFSRAHLIRLMSEDARREDARAFEKPYFETSLPRVLKKYQ